MGSRVFRFKKKKSQSGNETLFKNILWEQIYYETHTFIWKL